MTDTPLRDGEKSASPRCRFPDHKTIIPADWLYPHFQPWELADRRSGALLVRPHFLSWLEGVRIDFGKPMTINSGYREGDPKAHGKGLAVDVGIHGADALELINITTEHGVLGLGVQQTGPHEKRYLHLDMWEERDGAPEGSRPMCWSYA